MDDQEFARYVSKPLPVGRACMPFSDFPVNDRRRIARLAQEAVPPERWLNLGLCQLPSRAWYEWHWHRGIDPDKTRPPLSPTLRALVIARDGYVCGLCGGDVEPDDVHIDHVLPWSLGGKDKADNLQVAHSMCNMRKGARV